MKQMKETDSKQTRLFGDSSSLIKRFIIGLLAMFGHPSLPTQAFQPSRYYKVVRNVDRNELRLSSSHMHQSMENDESTEISEVRLTPLEPTDVSHRVFATDKRPIILFDGVCNLCNNAVNLALDWDPQGRLRFAALQSQVGRSLLEANGRCASDTSSIVLVTKEKAYIKSDAILKITEALTPPFLPTRLLARVGMTLVPKLLRDIVYDQVADNRYKIMGKTDNCRLDADEKEFANRFVGDDFAYRDR